MTSPGTGGEYGGRACREAYREDISGRALCRRIGGGGFWINDRLSYPIDPGMDGLEGSLKNWLNRGIDAVHGYQPRLYEPVTLGERTYVPMEVGEKLGYALLERSITGRYRIAHTSSGNAPFRCGVIEENGGKRCFFRDGTPSERSTGSKSHWTGAMNMS